MRTKVLVFGLATLIVGATILGACSNSDDKSDATGPNGAGTEQTSDQKPVSSIKAPDGWPGDIPLPGDLESVTTSSIDMDGKVTTTVGGESSMPVDDLKSFYKLTLKGWTQTSATEQDAGGMTVITYELDGRQLSVNISDVGKNRVLNLGYTPA